ncbi:MAG: hypothetical protein Kow0010_10650 [Dehalococcoidia bacterium]
MDVRSSSLLTLVLAGVAASVALGGTAQGWSSQGSVVGAALVNPAPVEAIDLPQRSEADPGILTEAGHAAPSEVPARPAAPGSSGDSGAPTLIPTTTSGPPSNTPAPGDDQTHGNVGPGPIPQDARSTAGAVPDSLQASEPPPSVNPAANGIGPVPRK